MFWYSAVRRCCVPSTPYFVLGLVVIAGCGTAVSSRRDEAEPSLVAQLALVRAGTSDEIIVAKEPLGSDDFERIAECSHLHVLLLDNAEQQMPAADTKLLSPLQDLVHLRIRGHGIDDAAVAQIANLKSLHILNLPHSTMSDAGLAVLKRLPALVQLRFGSPNVTDAGVRTIAELPALARLHLIDVPITDDGLRELAKIEQLESLYIDGGNFSDEALAELFRARPGLHVHLNQQHHDRDPHKHEHP